MNSVRSSLNPRIADSAAKIVQGNNEFALDLYSHLARSGASNLFFSPYSISSALAMTFAGARGETEQEMARVLRFRADQDNLHAASAGLNEKVFAGPTHGYKIRVANRLWGQRGYQLRPEFLELLRRKYGADLEQLDFGGQPAFASQKINRWVEEQTAGKIRNLISPASLNELTRLLLTNAIYFKGDWTRKFKEDATKEAPFHLGVFNKVKVQMMHQQAEFAYAKVGGVQVLELPYGSRDLSMVVLLPKRTSGLAKLESGLSLKRLNQWGTALVPQTVKVFFPRFCVTEQFALADVLRSMGMALAFSDTEADFSGMTDQKPGLCISDVIHKAFVEVNEEGTEAAAATAVIMRVMRSAFHRPPPIPVFRADHPFVFMIRHKESGSILFMGRVVNPKDRDTESILAGWNEIHFWRCVECGCSVKHFLGICWECGTARPGGEVARQEALAREEAALLEVRSKVEELFEGQPEDVGRMKRDLERYLRRIDLARSVVLTTAPMVAGSEVVDRLGTVAATGEECRPSPIVPDHYGEGYHGERHHADYGEVVVFMIMYKARQLGANAVVNVSLTPRPGCEASGEAVVIEPS